MGGKITTRSFFLLSLLLLTAVAVVSDNPQEALPSAVSASSSSSSNHRRPERLLGWNCASGRCPRNQTPRSSDASGDSSKKNNWDNWHLSGSASIASGFGVLLTPDEPSQQGAIWTLDPFLDQDQNDNSAVLGSGFEDSKTSFDLELRFRVSGRGEVGADGFALWYTERGLEERFDPTMTVSATTEGAHDFL
jgi:hypothetical protein